MHVVYNGISIVKDEIVNCFLIDHGIDNMQFENE